MSKKIQIELLVGLFLATLVVSCAKDDNPVEAFSQDLVIEIISGPADGGTILNNSRFTFEWRVRGTSGNTSFQVLLTGVDASPVTTSETSKSYPGQPPGSYTFTVTVNSGGESANDSRTFTVGANLGPPSVVISGARGSASSGGTGITPAYAPGQTAHFRWTGQDADKFGSVTGYRWKQSDNAPFTPFTLGTTAGFDVTATPGIYTFTVEAVDKDGAVSTTTINYEVKPPTILIVDDKPQASSVDEVDEDGFYASLMEGFAFATWDISEQGAPSAMDLEPYEVAIIYSAASSALWDGIGNDYPESPVPLSEFVDGGGRIWVMGQGIMENLSAPAGPDNNHSNPPDPTEFEAAYLHIAAATGDTLVDPMLTWTRAGEKIFGAGCCFDGDLKFSFADNLLGDAANYPRITIDVQAGDVEHIEPGAGAEIIYEGKAGLGDIVGNVGLRYPAGGQDTQVVFFTFPIFETRAVKASLISARALTQQIMREMGQ